MRWKKQVYEIFMRCHKPVLTPQSFRQYSVQAISPTFCCPFTTVNFHQTNFIPKQYDFTRHALLTIFSVGGITSRGYAKNKDRKKGDKGTKKKVEINEQQLSEVIKVDTLKGQMQRAVDHMKEEYVKNLSLRSTTGSMESLQVNFDGKEYTLQELAQIVRKNPKTIVINMAIFPQAIPSVLQAIQKSGMNLNPQQDKTTLYVPVPKVTKEHRENLAKNAKTLYVKCRDSIKDVQNKFIKDVKTKTNISQDDSHLIQDQIVCLADQYVSTAEKILEAKHTELIGKD